MSVDVHKMAAALLRHRAGELRRLKGEAFRPVLQKPTPGWIQISEGVVNLVADQLEDLAKQLVQGAAS